MYAQIIKESGNVVLIGGEDVGLPVFNHPLVICVDIGDRTDVKLGMYYDETSGKFYNKTPEPEVEPVPTVEERINVLEAENTKLKAELEITQAVVDELLFGGVE